MELALSARGSPQYFLDFWYRRLKEEDERIETVAAGDRVTSLGQVLPSAVPKKESKATSCLKELGLGKTPERGIESHPGDCWRAYNIKRELEAPSGA